MSAGVTVCDNLRKYEHDFYFIKDPCIDVELIEELEPNLKGSLVRAAVVIHRNKHIYGSSCALKCGI